jgi:hypothetical protein
MDNRILPEENEWIEKEEGKVWWLREWCIGHEEMLCRPYYSLWYENTLIELFSTLQAAKDHVAALEAVDYDD